MPELLQLVEEALDKVTLAVDRLFPAILLLAARPVGNVGNGALTSNAGAHAVCIVTFVRDDGRAGFKPLEQSFGRRDVVVVAGRDQEADRPAFGIDARVDFRREPAPASTDTTNSTLFFTPEACW